MSKTAVVVSLYVLRSPALPVSACAVSGLAHLVVTVMLNAQWRTSSRLMCHPERLPLSLPLSFDARESKDVGGAPRQRRRA